MHAQERLTTRKIAAPAEKAAACLRQIVGHLTSGAYGHGLGAAVGMGYVRDGGRPVADAFIRDGAFDVEVAGRRVAATASLVPFYDPSGRRMRD